MKWPNVLALSALAPLPEGYRYGRVDRAHVPSVIAALQAWYPDIAVGASRCYLREDFYRDRVCLDGDTDKDFFAARILSGDEMVGFWSFEREEDSLAIYGRLIALAPAHRGKKLSVFMLNGSESLGRVVGAAFMYALATLKDPYVQQALERAGYQLLGFFPGRDREEVAPGVVKRAYQAVYAKLLVPADQVQWPDPKNMTPQSKALFDLLFTDRPASQAR